VISVAYKKKKMVTDDPPSNVRIVGIGASAGGIESLKELFEEMPADTGLAFVVIQHLDPKQPSHMAGLLSKYTKMRVAVAEDGLAVHSNHVYTIPPNKFLSIKDGKLHLTETINRDGLRMPIDFFFRSLAEDQREKAIAVLLSGNGSDGTLGIREIHGMSGFVIVQDPNTALFDSMIQHALATGMVDQALLVRQIPGAILQFVRHNRVAESDRPDNEATQDGISSILHLLASQTKSDFRCYKPATIHRRIQRRMALSQINDISEYYRFLSGHPDELAKLSKDMLIGVTSFFRDPEAFEALRDKVIAPLVQEKNNAEPLRAWVTGCATGEEAYSVVMLLMEAMARARKSFRLQVFASDIDPDALKGAREGVYAESIAADMSEERLARFFIKQDGTYRVDKQVREAVTFAAHNVLLDPPFLNMDLISCRNLLIYIEPEIQKKILSLFAFGLKRGGYLFLGKSESPLEQSEPFEPVSKSFRIFRRTPSVAVPVADFALRAGAPAATPDRPERQRPIRLSDLNQQVLLKHFNASIVLIDENGEILHFYGPTHRYLSHPFGEASLSLFDMAENRHSPQLRLLVERAARQDGTVRLEGLEFGREDATDSVNVTVTPVVERNSGARLFAVIFEDAGTAVKAAPRGGRESEIQNEALIERLEAENKSLREQIQATSDGFQATHEEFTAANEEVMAINEELQSTNEELVTSKEELQSLNEELVTTNNQLNDKVEELGTTNDDLANFLNSSEVATIFLDRKFCIRRFTPSATELMNLLPLDVGRPVSHISNKFTDTDPVAIATDVLKTLIPVEKEVLSSDGRWHMLRCLPYRTANDVIDGVVFTFADVTRLKHSEEAMIEANRALLQDMEERKKLEDQLRQAQKMESMGTLAAGIAHDLNNILNIIQGYATILGPSGNSDEIGESVEAITETTKRGAALVHQLLTLARKTETKLEPTDANTVIQELSHLLKETFPKNIELALDLAPKLPLIMADPNLITQVLLNLCVNARDAMPDGGRLVIETGIVDGRDLEEYGDPKAEEYVSIEVTDTGTGMDENVQSRIFEPFFTTKEAGQGTGLGLAVAYAIVKNHDGFVRVKSQPTYGTTFFLYFPVVSSGE
jgi:two-component system, chemotaxis family, CheB/CheR fusion protein